MRVPSLLQDSDYIQQSIPVSRFLRTHARQHAWPAPGIRPEAAFQAARHGWLDGFLGPGLHRSVSREQQGLQAWNYTAVAVDGSRSVRGVWDLLDLSLEASVNVTHFGAVPIGGLWSYAAEYQAPNARPLQRATAAAVKVGTIPFDSDSVFARLVPVADIIAQMAKASADAPRDATAVITDGPFQPEPPSLPGAVPPGIPGTQPVVLPKEAP